jgi:hypothetical protein
MDERPNSSRDKGSGTTSDGKGTAKGQSNRPKIDMEFADHGRVEAA